MGMKTAVGGMYGEEPNGQYPPSRMRPIQSIHGRENIGPNQFGPAPSEDGYKKSNPVKKKGSQLPNSIQRPDRYKPSTYDEKYMKSEKSYQEYEELKKKPVGGEGYKMPSSYPRPSKEQQEISSSKPYSESPYEKSKKYTKKDKPIKKITPLSPEKDQNPYNPNISKKDNPYKGK